MQLEISEQKKDELLSVIQSGFPIVSRPFKEIAESIGLDEREVINAVIYLCDEGSIRTFGPVFEARKLGYVSTLIAAKVDPERISDIAAAMTDIHEITHNYLRKGHFNLWFTITALNAGVRDAILERIKSFGGVKTVLNLPAKKVFKINAVWGARKKNRQKFDNDAEITPLEESEKKLVRLLQHDFPIIEKPFAAFAGSVNMKESEIIDTINSWLKNGVIRRFGARLNHKKIGYSVNVLAAWAGDEVEKWGEKFAEMDEVSHCYLRESYDEWPFELYTMVHTRSDEEADKIIEAMKKDAPNSTMKKLKTLYELKKTSMKYFMEK
jgi:siroheme decarboxylase